jgi:hypothetical protein
VQIYNEKSDYEKLAEAVIRVKEEVQAQARDEGQAQQDQALAAFSSAISRTL